MFESHVILPITICPQIITVKHDLLLTVQLCSRHCRPYVYSVFWGVICTRKVYANIIYSFMRCVYPSAVGTVVLELENVRPV